MVTAELAACLPVLVLLLAVGLSAVSVANANIRAGDIAREAARLAARHDDAGVEKLVGSQPGVDIAISPAADEVVAVATIRVRPLGGMLPDVQVSGRAVAAVEPTGVP